MFGFFIAGASLLGLIFLSRHRHRYPGAPLRGVLRRLDASPAQERAIREATHEAREALREFRRESQGTKGELAETLQAESFDEARISQWLDGRKAAFDALTPRLLASLRRIHETLDAEQRVKISQFILRGGFSHRHHHHRGCHSC